MTSQRTKRGKHAGVDKTLGLDLDLDLDFDKPSDDALTAQEPEEPMNDQAAVETPDKDDASVGAEKDEKEPAEPVAPAPVDAEESEEKPEEPEKPASEKAEKTEEAPEEPAKPASESKRSASSRAKGSGRSKASDEPKKLSAKEKALVFAGNHEGLVGVGLCVITVVMFALMFWFIIFSGISSSADFLYNKF